MEEIIKKFKFKSNGRVINAPKPMEAEFMNLGLANSLDNTSKNKDVLVFVNNMKEFTAFLASQLKLIETDSVLWFAWPKLSSGIKTDINRDILRVASEKYGLKTVAAISIDDTWSAIRLRPMDNIGK